MSVVMVVATESPGSFIYMYIHRSVYMYIHMYIHIRLPSLDCV